MNHSSWRFGGGACALAALVWTPTAALAGSASFPCYGFAQYFVVPQGVTSVAVTATGAAGGEVGGGATSGAGGVVTATLAVTPNEVLTVKVGCQAYNAAELNEAIKKRSETGGFGFANGGNGALTSQGSFKSGGGGGATGIATAAGIPLIVAGGGGGGANSGVTSFATGGDGGAGGASGGSTGVGAPGGAGGALGGNSTPTGGNGVFGYPGHGGGGGGGYPTGGAGGNIGSGGAAGGGGGGGGLSYTAPVRVTNVVKSIGLKTGTGIPDDGSVKLSFNGPDSQQSLSTCTFTKQTYFVPAGATALRVIAIGAAGGAPSINRNEATLGRGGGVEALITAANFPANRQLTVVVGCPGALGLAGDWFSATAPGGAGGFGLFSGGRGGTGSKLAGTNPNDGAYGGSGGGGASGIHDGVNVRFPLITAGGGGGVGGGGFYLVVRNNGGNGGDGSLTFQPAANGTAGGGNGGGAGGVLGAIVFSPDGRAAANDTNAGGGGGAGGGHDTIDEGVTAVGGRGGTNIAAGGGGGSGGASGGGGGVVPVSAPAIDITTWHGRGNRNGLVIIAPIF